MPFVNEKQPGQNTITVDRERNITLINRRLSPEFPHRLELLWNEKKIMLDVVDDTRFLGLPNLDVRWKILRIYSPPEFLSRKDEIILLLKEALKTYGRNGSLDNVSSVSVDFTQAHWE